MNKLFFLPFLLLLAGCSSLVTRTEPNVDLGRYQRVFVEHRLSDGNGVDALIARELRLRGYDASFGPLTMMPDETQIVVSYDDDWTYDFTYYMIAIEIRVRKAHTDFPLAIGKARKPSVTSQSPTDMVDSILNRLFKAKPPLPAVVPDPAGLPVP